MARAIHPRGSAGVQSDSFKVTTRCHVPRVLHDTPAENRPSRPWTLASSGEARNKDSISRAPPAISDRSREHGLILEPDGPRDRRHFSSARTSPSLLSRHFYQETCLVRYRCSTYSRWQISGYCTIEITKLYKSRITFDFPVLSILQN